ncbi:MAG: Ig domain-containing protein, partial [Candidatus Bipolaricaulota bacterium]|nr:Ig domain-containing protein [Candidatus Bipolaricaulota bacterium]
GPGVVGPGTGDKVSANVTYSPWLAATPGTTPMTYGYAVTGGGTVDGTGEGIPVIATVTGTGTTTVTLEKYEGDPTGSTGFGSSFEAGYVDVYVPDVTSVSEIEIRVYYSTTVANETTLRLFWWNGTSWVECSDQGVNTVDVTIGTTEYGGYLWAKVTATSVPTLNQLNGTVFGGGSGLPASALWYEDFEYADQAAMNAVWTCGGSLWHLATETTVPSAAYSKLTPFPSSTHAAWFADPKTGKYGSGSAKAGSTTPEKRAARAHVQAKVVGYPYGVLTSPDISVSGLSAVNVSFKFFREVECYPQGQYDQTYTQVSFDGGSTWQTIWSKNSKDCTGMKSWQETGEIPVAVPSGATTMNLRFVFDALDNVGNDYLGWLIDDLTVSSSGAVGLRFAEESLDEGVVGNVYGSTVTVLGGYPEYVWRVLSGSVPGLTVTPGEATCAISGTPTQAGTYTLCLGVSDDRGQTYEKCYTIVIESQTSEPTAFWFDDFETDKGWTLSNGTSLWHRSATSCVSPAYASPTHVYYYGKDATCSYATGSKRNYGTLTSPVIPLTNVPAGTPLTIGWKYWRQVESYAGGSFDKTLVEISFDAGASWATIWTKDSADASSPGWNLVEIMQDVSGAEIVKPSAATSLLIRFFFDTTDGYANQYTGWLIDDVKAVQQSETPATLAITTQCGDLADGEVGKAYDGQLAASGGVPPYTWSSNPTPPIPGVTFDASTGALSGTPTTKGSYTPTFTVTDSVGSKAQLGPCTIDVAEASPCPTDLLLEGFEDLTGWGAQGLWHLTSGAQCVTCGLLAGNYPYFGVDNTCSYSTGARVQGALSSPAFPVDACVTGVRIAFDSFRHVEDFFGGSYDRTWVEVSWDNATWVQVWFKDSTTLSPTCENVVADLNVPAGATQMWIRFRFDSIDKFFNGFPGWAIDNLTVKNGAGLPGFAPKAMTFSAPAGSPRDQAGAVTILNIPNPVRDVHTTTFCVRGEGIEAIRIQIFDLAHTLVFEEEVDGTELIWHTVNTYGEYLANGVYLYRAFVLIDGDWIATPFEKLVILR